MATIDCPHCEAEIEVPSASGQYTCPLCDMDFEFDKFIKDIEKRSDQQQQQKNVAQHIAEQDRLRRLRSERYHERWQNRIVWEQK